MPIQDVGTGTTITFGTSGFSARVSSIDGPSMSRTTVETTHLATSQWRTHMPGDLADLGEITLTVHHDPSLTPPIRQAAETVTITFPVPSGLTNPATCVFTAMCIGYSASIAIDELMTASMTLKGSGAPTITAAS